MYVTIYTFRLFTWVFTDNWQCARLEYIYTYFKIKKNLLKLLAFWIFKVDLLWKYFLNLVTRSLLV